MAHREGHIGKTKLNFSAGVAKFGYEDAKMQKERDAVQSGETTKERGQIARSFMKSKATKVAVVAKGYGK